MAEFSIKDNVQSILDQEFHGDYISPLIAVAIRKRLSFAAWREPGQQQKHLIIDFSGEAELPDLPLEELPPGFIFSPFLENENSTFIKADMHVSSSDAGNLLHQSSFKRPGQQEILDSLLDAAAQFKEKQPGYYSGKENESETTKEDFIFLVNAAIESINQGIFEKVVPSRSKAVQISDHFDITNTFYQLCDAYPTAFVSLVAVPGVGTWLGATPETLLKIDQNQFFYTEALAGTQPLKNEEKLADIAWTQKEIEEQAMVSRYIINCFKRIRLREYEEHGPRTTVAGNLLHLKTSYRVNMKAANFPQLGSIMLELLHPTSAVCGMPKEQTLAFLLENENYDRSFYSGYLGPVNILQETHLFVNLRCMQLAHEKAVLYAGAGVTAHSNPEKEWQETEMKLNTLLDIIQPANLAKPEPPEPKR